MNMPRYPLVKFGMVLLLLGVGYLGLSNCQSVALLNAMVPNDRDSRIVATDTSYGTHDRQSLDIYLPKTTQAAKQPVLIFLYGGGWRRGAKDEYSFAGHAFASAGFVTLLPDYRLTPEAQYPDFLEDSAAALSWAKKNVSRFGGDPDKIFVVGHSAGAYNAVMMALAPEFLRKYQMEPADLAGIFGWAGPYDFLPLDTPSTIAAFGKAENLAVTQPVNRARALAPDTTLPPFYLMHGADDMAVGPYHTERLTRLLLEKNIEVTQKLYDGVDHADPIIRITRPFRKRSMMFKDTISIMRTISDTEYDME